ncbi:unnamed protein product [Oikopleura dioica]|uniref:AH domain-containing protein n=1 Tax=Oikopleura dioica TaxID=34765 RepID=E4X4L9_OIKDI|nr:unnamed protein product [Oikopleura dioica]
MSEEEKNKTEAQVPAPVVSDSAPTPVLPKVDISPDQTPLESPEAEDLPDRTIPIKNSQGETPQRSTIPKPDVLKNVQLPKELIPNPENLDKLKRWGLKHYRVNRQKIQELMGTATITADPELDPRVEKLHDHLTRYKELHQMGEELSTRFKALTATQKKLGDFFSEMSLKSVDLQDEFSYNADTQKALSKNGETLSFCLASFNTSLHTLIFKTMEDTLMIREYQKSRVEFDAYRTDLEKLQALQGTQNVPKDLDQKLETSTASFIQRKETLDKFREALIIKLKLLDENRHKVMSKQLLLLHNGVSAYFAGNQQALAGAIQEFSQHLQRSNGHQKSFLEQQAT